MTAASTRDGRVVVTGLGLVTPLGATVPAFWDGITSGTSAVAPIPAERFDAGTFETRMAACVRDEHFNPRKLVRNRKSLKIMKRAARYAVGAAHLAVEHAGLDTDAGDPRRLGVVMGAGLVDADLEQLAGLVHAAGDGEGGVDTRAFGEQAARHLPPLWLLELLPNMMASHISIELNAQGPNNTIVTACAAGTQAIGEAARLIQRGDADVVVAGGADSRITPVGVVQFSLLGALSTANEPAAEACKPFDARRDGMVLGEGAGVLVLESETHARDRGAEILAEVRGYGASFDAESVIRPHAEARGGADAMRAALEDARLEPADVDYVNAHGTATRLNDSMETQAIRGVFKDAAADLPVSSTKSMIGHLLAAAGAVEAAVCVLACRHGIVPPTINHEQPDPECDLDVVPGDARERPVRHALSNSFGFGGQNAALLLSRWED